MPIELPASLRAAIASDAGGQVTVVIGAGCSFEPPTSISLSKELSREAHSELVANGDLVSGACEDPENLSAVAEAVIRATGSQGPLVRVLPRHKFKSAQANRGYRLAAALLREGAIGDVITLNFDVAQSSAVSELDGTDVSIIRGPEFHSDLGRANVIYLHRNVDEPDPDKWILTREAMRKAWDGAAWETVVVRRSAAAPVVLFAGLGSPADVLEQSIREIRQAAHNEVYLAEPGDARRSPFFEAIEIDDTRVIPHGWVDVMDALGERVAVKQRSALLRACRSREAREPWEIGSWEAVESLLNELDLLALGRLRASWFLSQSRYLPTSADVPEQFAELFAVIQLLVRETSLRAGIQSDGLLSVIDDEDRLRGLVAFASGRGARSTFSIEVDIEQHRKYAETSMLPNVYVIAGVTGSPHDPPVPEDIATGESHDDLIGGWREWTMILADDICRTAEVERLIS